MTAYRNDTYMRDSPLGTKGTPQGSTFDERHASGESELLVPESAPALAALWPGAAPCWALLGPLGPIGP